MADTAPIHFTPAQVRNVIADRFVFWPSGSYPYWAKAFGGPTVTLESVSSAIKVSLEDLEAYERTMRREY
jgi:hypothetical protein